MDDAKKRRFQFSIQEMLLAAVLAFAGLCILTPLVPHYTFPFQTRGFTPDGKLIFGFIVAMGTMFGAFCGLWGAREAAQSRAGRMAWIVIGTTLAWAMLVVFFPVYGLRLVEVRHRCCATVGAASSKAYAEAQEIYHRTDYNGDGVREYATSVQELLKPGLVDTSFAACEGLPGKAKPIAGYVCKVLTAQGPCARDGRKSYLDENGRMTQGYALVMAPGEYDSTGRDMFIINHHGTIFQADLGPDTAKIFEAMTEFDPDPARGWEASE